VSSPGALVRHRNQRAGSAPRLDHIARRPEAGLRGPIWEEGRDERDIVRAVEAPRGERRYWWSETPDGAVMSFVSVADAGQ
jgi:hypothetical protein